MEMEISRGSAPVLSFRLYVILCVMSLVFFFWYMVDTIENLLEFKISFRSCVGVVIIGGCF